jgi:bifunctional DNase/RNase
MVLGGRSLAAAVLWILVSMGFPGEGIGELPSVTKKMPETLPVKIYRLILDPSSMQPVVLLTDLQEEKAMPIWIGPCEANAIQTEMEKVKPLRPQTHDLAQNILVRTGWKIQKIVITHSKDGIYYATLSLGREKTVLELDARPSDSLVLALKFNAPILVAKDLFREVAVSLEEHKPIAERYGLSVQELTPMLAESFSYDSTEGILVSDVRQGSQAEKDGMQRGDILIQIGTEAISDENSLNQSLAKGKATAKAKVFRNGKVRNLTLHFK